MTALLLGLLLGAPVEGPAPGEQDASGPGPDSIAVSRPGDARVYYWPGDSLRAERWAAIVAVQPPLPGVPDEFPSRASVYLAPSEAIFDSLTGGTIPDWGAGVAIPDRHTIVLPTFASERTWGGNQRAVFRHEWAHIGLSEYLDGLRSPRWFDEGYAQWASGGWDASEAWRLRVTLARGRAPPLDSLSLSFPRDQASAQVAYMLAATAVEYLTRASGVRGLEIFLGRWRESGSFESALRTTYGVTSGQFEEDWRRYVRSKYGWLLVLSHSLVFWGVLAALLLVMLWIRRGYNREKMARLRATEPPDRPAYWDELNPPPA